MALRDTHRLRIAAHVPQSVRAEDHAHIRRPNRPLRYDRLSDHALIVERQIANRARGRDAKDSQALYPLPHARRAAVRTAALHLAAGGLDARLLARIVRLLVLAQRDRLPRALSAHAE